MGNQQRFNLHTLVLALVGAAFLFSGLALQSEYLVYISIAVIGCYIGRAQQPDYEKEDAEFLVSVPSLYEQFENKLQTGADEMRQAGVSEESIQAQMKGAREGFYGTFSDALKHRFGAK